MKGQLFAACVLGGLMVAGNASAQSKTNVFTDTQNFFDNLLFSDAPVGKSAGHVIVRLRAMGVMPQNSSSQTSVGGHVEVTDQAAPQIDFSYFLTDHIAIEAIAGSSRHNVKLTGTAAGNIDVGSAWVLPPTITLEYHFWPHKRFSPYVGAGVNITFFYNTQANSPVIHKFGISTTAGAAVKVGFDYNICDNWFLNFDAEQIFANVSASANTALGHVSAKDSLNPLVLSAGIGYRF
jgi:outer membrane protein